ncbi:MULTISPECIES: triose-phosphate isomerase [unclassified Lentimicrobium]|uniref:triose-phosphate isomerase n=1 Tax=unclassified Lentimicrobium TaxID=2677434 RepID=UPI0015578AA1|nr:MULTISPECIES: triose-phosphate isomerase [unclassified Lentimicrobium]NPD45004.1 triose-phosphate isomerase [Lentimicrobium sp. S6]NPD83510.1 triose-phosphate isomerase [Lentimicrobium sp. L6]
MRKRIVAGNWKMNNNFEEADELLFQLAEGIKDLELENEEVIICPPALYLEMSTDVGLENGFSVGAQNCSTQDKGAYTGEISASMLKSLDVSCCLVGHSERRKYFNETHQDLALKVDQLLENEIFPIFCFGELLEERETEKHFDIVKAQIADSLFHLNAEEMENVILAYEPVWAIGTGVTATTEQAQEMHAFIRSILTEKWGAELAEETTILYGGSCNAKNAKELFSQKDVDGGLIGGASLKAEDFITIVKSFN